MSLALVYSERHDVSQTWLQKIGMAQLAENSIGEHWVLRECGDRHWNLLANAMGLSTPHFSSTDGKPLYAAFCATELELRPCDVSHLGQDLVGHSALYGVSKTRTASEHILCVDNQIVAHLKMMSAFVGHDETNRNATIVRKTPAADFDLPDTTGDLLEFCETALASARTARAGNRQIQPRLKLRPCPATDFNAVGLMYFANYSALANRAVWDALGASGLPRRRQIIYFGNVDRGEPIDVGIDEFPHGKRKWTFLRSDKTILAQGIDEHF